MGRKTRRQKRHTNRRRKQSRRKGGNVSLQVHYRNRMVAGQGMKKDDTLQAPQVSLTLLPGKLYSLVMWDPDVPDRFQPGWLHWLRVNMTQQNTMGNEIVSYMGPNPPSGTHRYYFVLFEQSKVIHPTVDKRDHFDINHFKASYGVNEINRVHMTVSSSI